MSGQESRQGIRLPDEALDKVAGGEYGDGGYYLTVGNCGGGYLALRPKPIWDRYYELAQLYPGHQVFTYGQTANGAGLNGSPCTYCFVCWNGQWGWADLAYLHRA